MTTHWIKMRGRRWHSWEHGAERSTCGRVSRDDLISRPPKQILAELPPEFLVETCTTCRRKSLNGTAENDTTAVWLGYVRLHFRRSRVRMADVHLASLARLLAEQIGAPSESDAVESWELIRESLLAPWVGGHGGKKFRAMPGLKDALALMRTEREGLRRVVEAMTVWRRLAGLEARLGSTRPDRIVSVILQIPDPETYVRHLVGRGLTTMSAVFSPGTLDRAKKESALRGMWSGSSDYWKRTSNQLNVITDDE